MIFNIEASLQNPDDLTEVTLVADVASVGTTRPLASGQILTWTEESLERFAASLEGMPVNAYLNEKGELEGHSRSVVGTIRKAVYDKGEKTLKAFASLWRHYYPETVGRLQEIFPDGKVQSSIEFLATKMINNEDGSVTPEEGRFGGLGLVGDGADKGQRVLLLASVAKDEGNTEEIPPVSEPITPLTAPVGSYEWVGNKTAEFLASLGTTDNPVESTVVGTFNNSVVYTTNGNTFRVNFERDGSELTFGEPVEVESTFIPLDASRKGAPENPEQLGVENMPDEKEFAELKASRDTLETELADTKKKLDALEAEKAQAETEKQRELLASARIEEIEKIAPYKDEETKAEHKEIFKTADEKTYEQFKKLVASTVEGAGGITSEEVMAGAGDDPVQAEALKSLPKWKEELLAQYASPAKK